MKLKVCGLTQLDNIQGIDAIGVDYLGFILTPLSQRNLALTSTIVEGIRELKTKKIGVFVDQDIEEVLALKDLLKLDLIQLHGHENPEYCRALQVFTPIIKVFNVGHGFSFDSCQPFSFADYFLFDTKGDLPGGNGYKFNWQLLSDYTMEVPYFLSGGIRPNDAQELCNLDLSGFDAIDVNSGFESSIGIKNEIEIKTFKDELST